MARTKKQTNRKPSSKISLVKRLTTMTKRETYEPCLPEEETSKDASNMVQEASTCMLLPCGSDGLEAPLSPMNFQPLMASTPIRSVTVPVTNMDTGSPINIGELIPGHPRYTSPMHIEVFPGGYERSERRPKQRLQLYWVTEDDEVPIRQELPSHLPAHPEPLVHNLRKVQWKKEKIIDKIILDEDHWIHGMMMDDGEAYLRHGNRDNYQLGRHFNIQNRNWDEIGTFMFDYISCEYRTGDPEYHHVIVERINIIVPEPGHWQQRLHQETVEEEFLARVGPKNVFKKCISIDKLRERVIKTCTPNEVDYELFKFLPSYRDGFFGNIRPLSKFPIRRRLFEDLQQDFENSATIAPSVIPEYQPGDVRYEEIKNQMNRNGPLYIQQPPCPQPSIANGLPLRHIRFQKITSKTENNLAWDWNQRSLQHPNHVFIRFNGESDYEPYHMSQLGRIMVKALKTYMKETNGCYKLEYVKKVEVQSGKPTYWHVCYQGASNPIKEAGYWQKYFIGTYHDGKTAEIMKRSGPYYYERYQRKNHEEALEHSVYCAEERKKRLCWFEDVICEDLIPAGYKEEIEDSGSDRCRCAGTFCHCEPLSSSSEEEIGEKEEEEKGEDASDRPVFCRCAGICSCEPYHQSEEEAEEDESEEEAEEDESEEEEEEVEEESESEEEVEEESESEEEDESEEEEEEDESEEEEESEEEDESEEEGVEEEEDESEDEEEEEVEEESEDGVCGDCRPFPCQCRRWLGKGIGGEFRLGPLGPCSDSDSEEEDESGSPKNPKRCWIDAWSEDDEEEASSSSKRIRIDGEKEEETSSSKINDDNADADNDCEHSAQCACWECDDRADYIDNQN